MRPGTPRGLRYAVAVEHRKPYGADLVCWPAEFPDLREPLVMFEPAPVFVDGKRTTPAIPQPLAAS
jgi:hypothetical protein